MKIIKKSVFGLGLGLMLVSGFFSEKVFAGPGASGGGDLCEDRFQAVREDLNSWIVRGGSVNLVLPSGVGVSAYNQGMIKEFGAAKIVCVGSGDQGFPVQIDGTPKICVFSKKVGAEKITCDFAKFQSLSQSDQYVLVHHEYAGLAGFEIPDGDVSKYSISNQLTDFLTSVEIKKLSVTKPSVQPENQVRVNFADFIGHYKIVKCDVRHQEGIDQPITPSGCDGSDLVDIYFGDGYVSPTVDGKDLFLDFVKSTQGRPMASAWLASSQNDASENCTTFYGNQFCNGQSDYTHYVQTVSMKIENGELRVSWMISQPDKDHYNYTSTDLILEKTLP